MSIDDSIGYELRADGRPIGIFRSLEQAQRVAVDHLDAGREVEITSLAGPAPSSIWTYDHARGAWNEARPYSRDPVGAQTGVGVASVLADCDSAHAFLDIAQASSNRADFHRNVALAERALAAVNYFLAQLKVGAPRRDELLAARDRLKARIEGLRRG
jgi:hypothetical protein